MKKFIEKKEQDKQKVVKEQACSLTSAVPMLTQSADPADCSQGRGEGQIVIQLGGGGQQTVDGVVVTADIPQLDGEAAVKEPEELVNLVYRFDHEKGRGDKETLKAKMRETMSNEVVKDIFVNHREEKKSAFGKKYNVFVTTLTVFKGKEKQIQWPRTVNGFLDVTLFGNL